MVAGRGDLLHVGPVRQSANLRVWLFAILAPILLLAANLLRTRRAFAGQT